MKKQFSAYVLSVLTLAMFAITSCEKDDTGTKNDGSPTACISAVATTTVGTSVTFTSCSTDGDTYLWEFSDNNATATTANTTHTFNTAGTYSVTLTVTNDKGTDTKSVVITVNAASTSSTDYAGVYQTTSSCGGNPFSYSLTVAANGANAITINNLSNLGSSLGTVNATINGLVVTIPQQQPSGSVFTVNGSGTLSSNKKTLNLSYTVSDGGSQSNCTSNGTKP